MTHESGRLNHRDAAELPDAAAPPLVSIVLCTWNRCELLSGALDALTTQQDAPPHEILVVNNASTDASREVILRYAATHPQVRYLEEPTAGVSHARNTGIAAARANLIAFTDDDIRVRPNWVRMLVEASALYPDAGCIGGPVLPAWDAPVPSWLTRVHWSPLGVQEYDAEPFRVDASRPVCLVGANLAVRRQTIAAVGLFEATVQRVRNGIGSAEDHEYHLRLWDAGFHGVYHPDLRVDAVVTAERLSKRYHRAWHFGHGAHLSRMHLPEMESSRGRLFGVPLHLARQVVVDVKALLAARLRRDRAAAFAAETRLWFSAGFVRERLSVTWAARRAGRKTPPLKPQARHSL
jgi:glucosyl-dolichyl phosphate glucuronosyltransferase